MNEIDTSKAGGGEHHRHRLRLHRHVVITLYTWSAFGPLRRGVFYLWLLAGRARGVACGPGPLAWDPPGPVWLCRGLLVRGPGSWAWGWAPAGPGPGRLWPAARRFVGPFGPRVGPLVDPTCRPVAGSAFGVFKPKESLLWAPLPLSSFFLCCPPFAFPSLPRSIAICLHMQ